MNSILDKHNYLNISKSSETDATAPLSEFCRGANASWAGL